MKNIKIHCSWDLEFDLYTEDQIELWVDSNPNLTKPEGAVRIGVFIEPPEIMNAMYLQVGLSHFDYILTHNQALLESNKNAFRYEFGGCWTKDYNFDEKKFGLSTLIGGKKMAHGHNIRSQVFNRTNEIKVPKDIWISKNYPPTNPGIGNLILSGTKSDMFETQFHICIENVKRDNWFTEKLLDCLYTKTVPIYYGCPNISEWFDERGFIIVDNVDEIILKSNSISPEMYQEMLPYIEENYKRSQLYSNVGENIRRSIEKNILPLLVKK